MIRSKKLLSTLTALSLLFSIPAWADDATTISPATHQQREAFAKNFAQVVINILHDPKKSYGDRKNILRQSFSSSVDIEWIAKFALGHSWRDATEEQRKQYTGLYRKFLTETYVSNFAENPDKSIYDIKILNVNDESNEFLVHTQMQLMNQVNLKVDYRVSDNNGTYKVLDIIIENVSLITTHRAEFTSLAAERGVDGVIRKLEQLTDPSKREITLSMK